MNNDKTKEECFDKQSFTHGGHEMFEHYSINHLVKDKLANESKNRQKIMTLIKGVNVKEGCLEQLQDNLARMKKMVEQRLKNCSYEVSSMKNPEERLIGTKMSTKDSFHEKEELGTFLKKMIFRKERYEEADTEKINAVLNNYHRLTSSFIGMTECLNT